MDNAILNKLMNLLISLARDVVVPPLGTRYSVGDLMLTSGLIC